ncbi:MAG: Nif11-like leader peptide family natural product precursor [Elusimicrobiota bacterium]|jgi:predicted ribosomally synthesized peptide with nif11-like leader
MSKDQVKAFIEKMKSDTAFRKRILAVEGLDARMALIKKEGFDCKVDDIQLYLEDYTGKDGKQMLILTDKKGCNGIYYGFCF